MLNEKNKMKHLKILRNVCIPKWLCENGTKDTILNAKPKNEIRKYMASKVKALGKTAAYLGLYGEGEDYQLIKRIAPLARLRMLDNEKGFDNKNTLKEAQKTTPELLIEDYMKFAKKGVETFNILWLDFCGQFSELLIKYLAVTPNIMQGEGEIYITIMEGRDSIFPKLMPREERRRQTIEIILDQFKKRGVEMELIYEKRYGSIPMIATRKTMRETPMWTLGFRFKKFIIE
mgnify:CR=1 FL=1